METITKKIEGVNAKKVKEGSIGFISEDKWYNVYGEAEVLEELIKNVVSKGNTIEFEYNNGVVGSLKLIEKAPEKENSKFDDMTNFEDLLDAAHEKFKGMFNIKTELVSMDYEKKQAIFSACVSVESTVDGQGIFTRVFTGHGDAEGIGSDMIKPHFIRMAETRAIARALRFATNNAKVSVEETSEVPKE